MTLSAPRNSNENPQVEPILFDSTGSDSSSKRRQSTATLISAIGASSSVSVRESRASQLDVCQLSRSEQDKELRRIASQRLSRKQSAAAESNQETKKQASSQTQAVVQKQFLQQQQQTQPQAHQNPKQLAIYINGKIRSNSIFCQSSSVNSFSSILNRFHYHTNNNNTTNQNETYKCSQRKSNTESTGELLENDKDSPLRLCQQEETDKPNTKSFDRRASRKLSNSSNEEDRDIKGATQLATNLRSRAQYFLRNYLLPSSDKKTTTKKTKKNKLTDCRLRNSYSDPNNNENSNSESYVTVRTKEDNETNKTSYKLNPSSMFLRKAMRYYRLWIYCTNITILIGTLIFILATIYVVSDYRFKLLVTTSSHKESSINSEEDETSVKVEKDYDIHISYTEPSVIITYAVIVIQAGVLQAIGCFGAIRMKERWIQAFWYLILGLTVFDVVFLLHWLNRYDFVVRSLHHHMTSRLSQSYGQFAIVAAESPFSIQDQASHLKQQTGSMEEVNLKLDKILTVSISKQKQFCS